MDKGHRTSLASRLKPTILARESAVQKRKQIMELQTFVENTVLAIARGVEAARKASDGIAPSLMMPGEDDKVGELLFTQPDGKNPQPVFMVEFDVAVSASDKTSVSAGGGIRVLEFLSAEGKRDTEKEASTVSRIKFRVPVRLT